MIATQRVTVSRLSFFCFSLALNTFLILSHTLGLIYSGVILVTALVCRRTTYPRLTLTAATLSSWSLFLLLRTAVRSQAGIVWGLKPGITDFLRYFLKNPFSSRPLDVIFYVCILLSLSIWVKTRLAVVQSVVLSMLSLVMIMLFLMPPLFALLAQCGIPLAADRYLMPYLCGCLIASNYMMSSLTTSKPFGTLTQSVSGLAFAVAIVVANWTATESVWFRPVSDLEQIVALPGNEPVVINDSTLSFQLHYYYPNAARRFIMVFPDSEFIPPPRSGGAVLAKFGYLRNVQPLSSIRCWPPLLALDNKDNYQLETQIRANAPNIHLWLLDTMSIEGYRWSLIQLMPESTACDVRKITDSGIR